MHRIAVVLAFSLTACVLDEATDPELAEVESEAATSGPTVTELADNEYVTISGAPQTIRYFKFEVPAARDHVAVWRDGPTYVGADIYMKRGSLPTASSYDCRRLNGTTNQCKIDYAAGGTYYIMVQGTGTRGYSNMTLHAHAWDTYAPIVNGYSMSIYNQYGVDYFYKLSVPDGTASVTFTFTLDPDDDGGLDLVVKRGKFATTGAFDCKREINWYQWAETGTCTFTNPPAGTYYVGLLGYDTKVVGTFTARYRWGTTFSGEPVYAR